MALKRKLKNSIEENKDVRIARLESLLKELTEELGKVVGYKDDKPIAPTSTYSCYG